MKLKTSILFFLPAFLLALPNLVHAQGSAFTYQGRLTDNGNPASGTYDLRLRLASDQLGSNYLGGTLLKGGVAVTGGLFTVTLDFGAAAFNGSNRWLQVDVRTNGAVGYTALAPLQPLTPTPYAIMAATASNLSGSLPAAQLTGVLPSAQLSGSYGGTVAFSNAGDTFTGAFTGNGAGLSNLNAATLNGLSAGNFWIVGGNAGTAGASLGTTDNQPLKLIAGNRRALQLETKSVSLGTFDSWSAVNTLGGASGNIISNGVMGGTIAGGGAITNHLFGSEAGPNAVLGNFATVGGGLNNTAGYAVTNFDDARAATVAGGENNIAGNAYATVSGGQINNATGYWATVGGGLRNNSGGYWATVGGGYGNTANGAQATVGGGVGNNSDGAYATVPGGALNSAAGDDSFAAGTRAKANHAGAFVWADSQPADFGSTATNQFLIRASGGVGIGTGSPGAQLDVASTGNTAIRISGPTAGGPGVAVACEFATYSPGLNPPSARILATDDGNWSDHLDLMTKIPGAAGNALQSRLHIASSGSVGIGTLTPVSALQVIGTVTATAFNPPSDRNLKENFAPVSSREVLEKVTALPISRWNFKGDTATPHVGPMAQDFHAAFRLGTDERHIATVDADGVALAAIQGLNQKLMEELKRRDLENADLRNRLEAIELMLKQKSSDRSP